MRALSHATSAAFTALLLGPKRRGSAITPRHLLFGSYVVILTAPGAPRMPNGVETSVEARMGQRAIVGGGELRVGRQSLEPGPGWNPRPSFLPFHCLAPGPEPRPELYAGRGAGLTPAGDDLLAGYVAGLVLLHGETKRAKQLAMEAAGRTVPLSATLLRHAARGEVPEPVHILLASGDTRPLLAFGHSSGIAWLRGLVSAGYPLGREHEMFGHAPVPANASR
jgi:Protein of unknown function (DUF2877)